MSDKTTSASNEKDEPATGKMKPSSRTVNVEQLVARDLPVLFGRYEIQSVLGPGGMARVFRAELRGPAGFRKSVALKVIKIEAGQTVSNRQVLALVREACLGGQLKHPNLVDVYELGEVNGRLFISMELVEGGTLAQLIRSNKPIPIAIMMEIAVSITAGLAKAHGQTAEGRPTGLVHRDLKPSNILLSRDGAVKIADFGIAVPRDEWGEALATSIRGTVSYMSPEQVKGETLDGRSDLFSLALVIGEMVLGKQPIEDKYVYRRLHTGQPLEPPLLPPEQCARLNDVIPGLGEVLLRCLAPEREDRYPDADHLLEDLLRLQESAGFTPQLRTWFAQGKKPSQEPVAPVRRPAAHEPLADSPDLDASTALLHFTELRGNLAPSMDHFVGRESELAELERCFRDGARLVTLKGVGGAGKTRFSRRYARTKLSEWEGGAWFVDLTEAISVHGVLHATAAVLDVPLGGEDDVEGLVARVGRRIADRGVVLIVLDNFEQVVKHAPTTVGNWLTQAPKAMFLVTSREPLRLSAERVFPLLPLPEDDGATLFKLRARAAGATWQESKATDGTIHQIVKRLDGIPLAIELAAARARMMSPGQILDRMSQRFKLLRGGRRGDAARQATLRGLIDWSWDLLEPWEQSALAQLSVFHDGFFMEAAEAVLDLSDWPEAPWSLDVVGSLLDKSLLHSRQVLEQPRFEMYVSIQEYAAEKLNQVDDEHRSDAPQEVRNRHTAWFGRMGALEPSSSLAHAGNSPGWAELFCELENLVAGTGHGTPETAAQCCIAALRVLSLKGPASVGVDLAAPVLARPGLPLPLRLQLVISRSRCLRLCGRMQEAIDAVRSTAPTTENRAGGAWRAMPSEGDFSNLSVDSEGRDDSEIEDGSGDRIGARGEEKTASILEGNRLLELGHIEREQSNHDKALWCYTSALEIYRKFGHKKGAGEAFDGLANIYQSRGKLGEAIEYYQVAFKIAREMGHRRNEGTVLGNLGTVYQAQGRFDEAIEHYLLSIEIAQQVGHKRGQGLVIGNLGTVYQAQGRLEEAKEHYLLGLEILKSFGHQRGEVAMLGNLGELLFHLGQMEEAQTALENAISTCQSIGYTVGVGAFSGSLALLFASQGQYEEAYRLLETGELQLDKYPKEHGKFLCKKGQVQLLDAKADAARDSLARARSIADELKVGAHSELNQAIAELKILLGIGEPAEPTRSTNPASNPTDDETLSILEGTRLLELGHIEREQSNHDKALWCYTSALEIYRKFGHKKGAGEALNGLGNVYQHQGKPEKAIEHYLPALKLHREAGNKVNEGMVLGNLGLLYQSQGKLDEATEHYQIAFKIAQEMGDKRGEGSILGNLGLLYRAQGKLDEATKHFELALQIHKAIGSKRGVGTFLGNLGDTFFRLGRMKEAQEALESAISTCDEVGFAPAAGAFRGSLALLLAGQGRCAEAHRLLEMGEPQINAHPEELGKFLCKKGRVQLLDDAPDTARASLVRAQAIAEGLEATEHSELILAIAELKDLVGE